MAQRLSLTVLILTPQVTERFVRCLKSVQWAAEVVVGWTSAQPLSGKVLKSLRKDFPQMKVLHIPGLITRFAAVRNLLQKHAQHDWVFWIDSDEELEKGAQKTLREVIASQQYSGIVLQRIDIFAGKTLTHGEVKNIRPLRIFRKSLSHFERPVHEVVVTHGELYQSSIMLYHHPHASLAEFLAKIIRYAQIEADFRYQKGIKTSVVELVLWPLGKFLYNMFLRLAYLDGWQGVAYATMMSIHSLAVRAYLLEKSQHHENS